MGSAGGGVISRSSGSTSPNDSRAIVRRVRSARESVCRDLRREFLTGDGDAMSIESRIWSATWVGDTGAGIGSGNS